MKLQIAAETTRKPQTLTCSLPADILERLTEYAKPIGSRDYVLAQILDQVLPVKKQRRGGRTEGATA